MDGGETRNLSRKEYDSVIDNVTLTNIFKDYLRHSMPGCFTVKEQKLKNLGIPDYKESMKYCTYDGDKYFNFYDFSIDNLHTISENAINDVNDERQPKKTRGGGKEKEMKKKNLMKQH